MQYFSIGGISGFALYLSTYLSIFHLVGSVDLHVFKHLFVINESMIIVFNSP